MQVEYTLLHFQIFFFFDDFKIHRHYVSLLEYSQWHKLYDICVLKNRSFLFVFFFVILRHYGFYRAIGKGPYSPFALSRATYAGR